MRRLLCAWRARWWFSRPAAFGGGGVPGRHTPISPRPSGRHADPCHPRVRSVTGAAAGGGLGLAVGGCGRRGAVGGGRWGVGGGGRPVGRRVGCVGDGRALFSRCARRPAHAAWGAPGWGGSGCARRPGPLHADGHPRVASVLHWGLLFVQRGSCGRPLTHNRPVDTAAPPPQGGVVGRSPRTVPPPCPTVAIRRVEPRTPPSRPPSLTNPAPALTPPNPASPPPPTPSTYPHHRSVVCRR